MQSWNALTGMIRRKKLATKKHFALHTPIELPQILRSPNCNYLVCTTVVKNDGPYLDEWLQFHLQMGVQHFYIYDNGSTDDTLAVLLPYQEAGLVTVIPWRQFSLWANTQRLAYAHALSNFGSSAFWMGFFDVDEFMFTIDVSSLPKFLSSREDFPSIAVTGINFGTHGHRTAPDGLVTESYCRAVPMVMQWEHNDLLNVKSIVQPGSVASIESAHWFNFRNDKSAGYNEDGEPLVRYPRSEPKNLKANVIRYNHYYTRSLEEFLAKVNGTNVRGENMNVAAEKRWSAFRKIEQLGAQDDAIQKYLPELKARLSMWRRFETPSPAIA